MNNAELIRKAADKYKKDIVAFARNIIRTPSFSCQEGKLVALIKKEMLKVGFDKVKVDRMGNIIGFIGHGKKKIMLDLKLEGDYTLMVVGSVMEEDCDGLPLLHLINKEKIRPDYVVITEPTNLAVYRGHRGRMEMKVIAKGRSCHASAPERGDNAVVKMAAVIRQITDLNKKLKKDKFLGKGTVVVTSVECKTPSLNAVPDECTIYLDRRLTAGETLRLAVAQIERLASVRRHKAKVEVLRYDAVAWTGLRVGQEKYYPTWVLPESHKLVKAAKAAGRIALGKAP